MPPRYPPPKKGQFPPGFLMPILPPLVPVVLCAPSGGGKTTLMNRLLDEYPRYVAHSASPKPFLDTTRNPRVNEVDGKDYHFVNQTTMESIIQSGQLLEYMTFAGNTYGTAKKSIDDILRSGKICLLTLDINGCDAIRKAYKDAKLIFIMPPNKTDLEKRILTRQGTSEDLKHRLDRADEEMTYAKQPGKFDLILTNDDFDRCYYQLVQFLSDLLKLAKDTQEQIEINQRVNTFKERRLERMRKRQNPDMDNSDLSTGVLTSSHMH